MSDAIDDDPQLCRGVTVRPGTILVNEVWCVRRSRNVYIYKADLVSKYADVLGYGVGGDTASVMLWYGDDTLYRDESVDIATAIDFRVRGKLLDWSVVAHCARYSLYVIIWRQSRWMTWRTRLMDNLVIAMGNAASVIIGLVGAKKCDVGSDVT